MTWVRDRATTNVLLETALVVVIGLITIGVTAFASTKQDDDHGFGVAGVALLATAVLALPFRHRFPVPALVVAVATTWAYVSLGYARGPVYFTMIVALVSVVLKGYRVAAIAVLVAGFVGFSWGGYLLGRDDRPTVSALVGLAAWLITLISVAEVVRSRRDRAEAAAVSQAETLRRRTTEERLQIARELHDVVAHNMSLISIQAGVALHLMDQNPEQVRSSLTTIKQASKDALVELRSILGVLRQVDEAELFDGDAPRTPTSGLARLGELTSRSGAAGVDVRVEVEVDDRPAGVDDVAALEGLPRPVDLAAFRIVQESLTNVAKHSSDLAALVRLHRETGGLSVEVLDEGTPQTRNGRGFAVGGYGIAGMRERAAAVGGWLEAGPRPGRGFAVRAWLPFDPADVDTGAGAGERAERAENEAEPDGVGERR